MKIQGDRPEFDKPLAGVETSRGSAANPNQAPVVPAQTSTDKVHVSSDAQLASAAIEAAKKASDVRPEAVARGKALLKSGELGADAEHLADALIDRGLVS